MVRKDATKVDFRDFWNELVGLVDDTFMTFPLESKPNVVTISQTDQENMKVYKD